VFYELIFESGAHSVAFYESEEEMLDAVKAHHERATKGEDGGPSGDVATRIVKVLAYEQHPSEAFSMSSDVAAKELPKLVEAATTDGVLDSMALAASVRNLNSPLVDEGERHDSMYKAKEAKAFTDKEWAA
jgi:hypothetical protein